MAAKKPVTASTDMPADDSAEDAASVESVPVSVAEEQLATFKREVEMTRERHAMAVAGVHGDVDAITIELDNAEAQFKAAGGDLRTVSTPRSKQTRPKAGGEQRGEADA